MTFDFSKKRDRNKDLPTLSYEDGEIEIETSILNTHCGLCHHLQFTGADWRDKFLCNVYSRVLNQTVNPEFGEGCKYFNFERLYSKKPQNEAARVWMERTNIMRGDEKYPIYIDEFNKALRRAKWINRAKNN